MIDHTLCWMSATELVEAYRKRTLSPVEVTKALLGRIEALNPQVNAYCWVSAEYALATAGQSEERWRRGTPLSAIDGVPAAIKDLILTRDVPTRRGSKTINPAGPWNDDGPSTARLREAGAVLVGKTTTPEFGWKGATDSLLTGITRNPWDLTKTPGGSSGGASAALAAGLAPLHVGTDGGGSIRIPSAFCATVGIKAQFGRVPAWPLSPMGTLAHVGPMTRTVQDAALLLGILAKPDARDPTSLPPPPANHVPWQIAKSPGAKPLHGLRVAYSPRLGYVRHVDPEILQSVEKAVGCLEDLGANVELADPAIPDCAPVFTAHWFTLARHNFKVIASAESFAQLEAGLQTACEKAAKFSLADYINAQKMRLTITETVHAFLQKYDILITPAVAVPAFEVGRVMPDIPSALQGETLEDWTWWTPFSFPFNLTQHPAMSVNCGFTKHRLPIGMQIVAPSYREDRLLQVAQAYTNSQAPIRWPEMKG